MKITIIPSDSLVGIDGVFRHVNVSDVDSSIHAIQFNTANSEGEVEFRPDVLVPHEVPAPTEDDPAAVRVVQVRPGNKRISEFPEMQAFIDRWTAAAPPPPPPPLPAPMLAIIETEASNPITHRALREFFIGFGEANPAFKSTLLYQRVKTVDDAIKAERAKL